MHLNLGPYLFGRWNPMLNRYLRYFYSYKERWIKIVGNYPMSYAGDVSDSISKAIWDKSKCEFCLDIKWDFRNMNTTSSS